MAQFRQGISSPFAQTNFDPLIACYFLAQTLATKKCWDLQIEFGLNVNRCDEWDGTRMRLRMGKTRRVSEEQVKKSERSGSHELKRKVDFNRILVTCSVNTFIPNKSRVLTRLLVSVTYHLSVRLNAFR